jgi:hypothetical protein
MMSKMSSVKNYGKRREGTILALLGRNDWSFAGQVSRRHNSELELES